MHYFVSASLTPFVVVVQLLSCVQLFATSWTAARQASLSSTISWSLLRFMSIELMMPSNHCILRGPVLLCVCTKSLQSCPTFCDSIDCSLPGSSVNEIFQERILEWVVISCSRESFQPRDRTCVSCIFCTGRLFITVPPGKSQQKWYKMSVFRWCLI